MRFILACVAASAVLQLSCGMPAPGALHWRCEHCNGEPVEPFTEYMLPEGANLSDDEIRSKMHLLWSTHVEVVPMTEDVGGPLPVSFHKKLAKEAIRGWRKFAKKERHDPPTLNDRFFHYQKRIFEAWGDMKKINNNGPVRENPHPDANASWPEMCALDEFKTLRKVMEFASRRYLIRSGYNEEITKSLNYSLFSWMGVHASGEFHGPHTHVGEYHVAVFYSKNPKVGGRLRFGDPRGQSPPFGKNMIVDPRPGELWIFPAWLSHMATVTAPHSANAVANVDGDWDDESKIRVTFAFNIGPHYGALPCFSWVTDETAQIKVSRSSRLDPKELDLD